MLKDKCVPSWQRHVQSNSKDGVSLVKKGLTVLDQRENLLVLLFHPLQDLNQIAEDLKQIAEYLPVGYWLQKCCQTG